MEAFFIMAAKLLLYPHYTAEQIKDWFKGKTELPVTGAIREYILNDQSYLFKDNSNIIGYNPEFQYIEQFYQALESSDGTFHDTGDTYHSLDPYYKGTGDFYIHIGEFSYYTDDIKEGILLYHKKVYNEPEKEKKLIKLLTPEKIQILEIYGKAVYRGIQKEPFTSFSDMLAYLEIAINEKVN